MGNVSYTPKKVIIIRHGEKPNSNERKLSIKGKMRAAALAFHPLLADVDLVFAAQPSKGSKRSVQTVKPLALKLGLKINKKYKDSDVGKLVSMLQTSHECNNKIILLCWHHSYIPELVKALGAKLPTQLSPWPDDVFDLF